LGRKLAWGVGGANDYLISMAVYSLVTPIFNVYLGLDVRLVGLAIAIPRLVDAFSDPIIGHLSDNTRSRWGRRRPWMLAGALLSAVLIVLLWLPDKSWSPAWQFGWLLAIMMLYFPIAYSMYSIPYNAMGFDLTDDYDERTRVLTWRFYFGLSVALLMSWLYKIVRLPYFGGDEMAGSRVVSYVLAALFIAVALVPILLVPERAERQNLPKAKMAGSLMEISKNRSFLVLALANLLLKCGIYLVGSFLFYINLYYIGGGGEAGKDVAASVGGWSGMIQMGIGLLSMPLFVWISRHTGKKSSVVFGLWGAAAGYLTLWWAMTPAHPYLQLLPFLFIGLMLNGCWVLIESIMADVCDEDELRTGQRREGTYWSVLMWSDKVAMALVTFLGAVLLSWAGYVEGPEQTPETMFNIRLMFVVLQAGGLFAGGLLLLVAFPLTRARAADVRSQLAARKETAKVVPAGAGVATVPAT
jgi:GPH family glycoside/pentoside/hexuronide:cation symporter